MTLRKIYLLTLLMTIPLVFSGCGSSPEEQAVTDTPLPPLETPAPTSTPLPAPTSTPTSVPPTPTVAATATNTPLPEGVIFRDDFNGSLQPGWRWELEEPSRWTFVEMGGEQWLQLTGSSGRSNVLMRELPVGNFALSAHVVADSRMNFHQANIFVFDDVENYVAVNTGYCGICPVGGPSYFMETVTTGGGAPSHHYEAPRESNVTEVYLKIEVVDNVISGYYATSPDDWIRIGRFGNFFELNSIGLSATNSSPPEGTPEDIVAQFDYFEVTSLP